jgi:hypothetical protein
VSSYTTTARPEPGKNREFRRGLAPLVVVFALGAAGCEATFTPGQATTAFSVATASVPQVPYDIATYPHVWYEGTWIYLVDGSWYAPTLNGWVVLREEPRELGRYRRYYEPAPSRRRAPTVPEERGRYRTY